MGNLGPETAQSHEDRIKSGFYKRYMSGQGLDIGYKGDVKDAVPVLPNAIGVDTDYPGYDGIVLPFKQESMDFVYSSHCLEHIPESIASIKDWFRVIKIGGYLIITVPHQYLYEKKIKLPSNWNFGHRRFYMPDTLLMEIKWALPPNHWRLRECYDNDKDYDYSIPPDEHAGGAYEIVCVIQKIEPPRWNLLP
jgi:SAM-dependent methyltransferase